MNEYMCRKCVSVVFIEHSEIENVTPPVPKVLKWTGLAWRFHFKLLSEIARCDQTSIADSDDLLLAWVFEEHVPLAMFLYTDKCTSQQHISTLQI